VHVPTLFGSGKLLGPILFFACLGWLGAAAPASPAKAVPQVYFVAGVSLRVEVMVDGASVSTLAPKAVMGPVDLAEGRHQVEFRSAKWTVRAEVMIDRPSVDVVVHRPADAADDPVVTVFTNDLRPIGEDRARLTVAHTAVVPPADIRVDGKVLFANVANGEFATVEVPADTYSVDIVPTEETTPLFGPIDLTLTPGALNRVFAVGRPEDGSMDAVVQVIALRTTTNTPPKSVGAGSAGLVAPAASTGFAGATTWPVWVLLGLGTLAPVAWVAGRRSRAHTRVRGRPQWP
jgi:hypothetical protein